MADVSKIKLPDQSIVNIKDYRIPGVDTTPTSGSSNLITSGGVYQDIEDTSRVVSAALNDLNDRIIDIEEDWVTTEEYSQIEQAIRDTYTKQEIDVMLADIENGGVDDAVTQVKVGAIAYNPSNGIVSLPEYPTTLPASDVSAWAKASTKPTYTASEVGAATESYVDTAVAGIVNSAPTTLDTLNELATALGNDPNFATTVATQIGEKVSKTSSTDNAIVRFNGTNGEIQNSGVTIDDNNNIVTAGALYLTNIGSSVSNSTSRLYFGSQSSPYNYITANTSGVFGIYRSSDGKGVACYPNENFFSNSNIDLGRTQSLWKNLYLSGTIGNGTYSLTLPNKSGTIATTDDIPAAVTESTVSGWGFTKNAAPGTLKTNATTAQTASSGEVMSGTITLHKIAKTGTYSDLIGTPTIPTKVSDLTNDSGFTSNTGTITGITMNGSSKGTSGVVNLGTVITSETQLSKGSGSGSGNVVTDISVSNHQITLTKGATVPVATSANAGKIPRITSAGAWEYVTPSAIYSGSGTPSNSTGNNGDIYLQTS